MIKRTWLGGYQGTETMPEDFTKMYYAEVQNDIPKINNIGEDPNYQGYFDGASSSQIHSIKEGADLGIRNIIKCTINGHEVDSEIVSPETGSFKISSSRSGYVKLTYLPYVNAVYFDQQNLSAYIAPIRVRLVPFRKEFIDQMLTSINSICEELQIPKSKFSIEPQTGNPIEYDSSIGVDSTVPIRKQLFTEIVKQVAYLNDYIISNPAIDASILPTDLSTYRYSYINAYVIRRIREEINIIEGAI